MSYEEYTVYTNLHIYAKDWCKYKQLDKVVSHNEYRNDIQHKQYVLLKYQNTKTDRYVYIYQLSINSKYASSSSDLKSLFNSIKANNVDVILVTKNIFNIYGMRAVANSELKIKMYLYRHFIVITPKLSCSDKHEIMTPEEINNVLNNELKTQLVNLPRIYDNNPMIIWIGAEIGDMIRITTTSDYAGYAISYRVVVPHSHNKIVAFRGVEDIETEETPEAANYVDISDGSDIE